MFGVYRNWLRLWRKSRITGATYPISICGAYKRVLEGLCRGSIFTGASKSVCVPGLNCYSCPGALGSCPIGAVQATLGNQNFKMAFYVTGFLMVIGAFLGRLVCGWLCPFGLVQDLLHKIPFGKKLSKLRGKKYLKW